MDVTDQLQQIRVFMANNRFVPTLKDMGGFTVAQVEILAAGLLETLHKLG